MSSSTRMCRACNSPDNRGVGEATIPGSMAVIAFVRMFFLNYKESALFSAVFMKSCLFIIPSLHLSGSGRVHCARETSVEFVVILDLFLHSPI